MYTGRISFKTIGATLLTTLLAAPSVLATPVRADGGAASMLVAGSLLAAPQAKDPAVTPAPGPGNAIGLNRNGTTAAAGDYTAYPPLNVGAVPPLVMLVMSRDEQLYIKAYTDYTDLNADGVVDITYEDKFDYSGYFDPNLCYGYASGVFKASAAATDANGNGKAHECNGQTWSGNFLNWSAMSRIDVLRYVLYGGNRSVDEPDRTVLERAYIPSDLHAWAKVYTGSDVNSYTPFTTTQAVDGLSMCNVSPTTSSEPQLRVAAGNFTQWASTALAQCRWRDDVSESGADINKLDSPLKSGGLGSKEYTVRVEVCDPSPTAAVRESFCRKYTETADSGSASTHWKPAGLLQSYGENGSMRFGLITGTYSKPRAGGVLRRNIGLFAGNGASGCTYDAASGKVDEVNLQTGQFCNQGDGSNGIINTLRRFRITSWNPSNHNYNDCSTYGILPRKVDGANGYLNDPGPSSGYDCKDSGNPLAEMYAEALRYIHGDGNTPTTTFNVSDAGIVGGLPLATWLDPYRDPEDGGNPYCANCSIIVITTGLDSFDSDQIPTVEGLPKQANAATDEVGASEDLSGSTSGKPPKYLVGRSSALSGTTYQDVCTPKFIASLSTVFGICPDVPSLEGGYQMAGLAYEAWTNDMRPDKEGEQKVQTYAIALAETLPTFQISVRDSNSTTDLITITPACQANNDGGATLASSSGWRSCYLGDLSIGLKTSTTLSQDDWLRIVQGKTPNNAGSCGKNGRTCRVFGLPYTVDANGEAVSGSFAITWEDSQWGNDHDNDVVEMLSFCKGAACRFDGNNDGTPDICEGSPSNACNNVKNLGEQFILVRTEAMSAYAGNALRIGYTTAGAFNAGNGEEDAGAKFTILRPGNNNGSLLFGNYDGAGKWTPPQVEKYSSGPAEQLPLPNPLFFAAKYGGFTDQNGDGKPDRESSPEWDLKVNDTGDDGADGVPDNYFLVRNPAQLAARLSDVFNNILARSGSGTAAAVVANSANGVGLTYQALYEAQSSNATQTLAWTGTVRGLWTDSYGYLRSDANNNRQLDDYTTDPVIVFYYDEDSSRTMVRVETMPPNDDGSPVILFDPEKATVRNVNADEIAAVWSAQDELSNPDLDAGDQRVSFGDASPASDGSGRRYIFTWIDKDHDGVVDRGEQQPFVWSSFSSDSLFRYLNTDSASGAEALVDWIRGSEITDSDGKPSPLWRSRTVDIGTTTSPDPRVMRLGDIVDSTPVVVGTPAEAFDLLYSDPSYGLFREQYRNRRQVVYVGANDGMLHAFNGGFYNAREQKLQLRPTKVDGTLDTSVTAQPLGSELWAYVPGNLLPHLRWLADPDYAHMFYVDGNPIAQDVKIFSDDDDHPDGWGTVLIVPFRFGGGPISVPTGADGKGWQNSFSAYVVLDVTNPEEEPTVLAELTNTRVNAGVTADSRCSAAVTVTCATLANVVHTYTSSVPAAAMFRNSKDDSPNKFFLFTGSGTTDNGGIGASEGGNAVSAQSLRIRAYDLAGLAKGTPDIKPVKTFEFEDVGGSDAGANSFAGDLLASDYNLNGLAEGLYFGSVKDNGSGAFGGALWKLDFMNGGADVQVEDPDPDNWHPRLLLADLDRPVTAHVTVGVSDAGKPMVFAGSGRAFTKDDLSRTDPQMILGMLDTSLLKSGDVQKADLPLHMSDLVDVTDVDVTSADDGSAVIGADSGIDTFQELFTSFDDADKLGWYINLQNHPVDDSGTVNKDALIPAERVVSSQALLGGVLLTTTFLPGTDTCTDTGSGRLYGMNYKTGTADPSLSYFGTTTTGGKDVVNRSTELGPGLPAAPSLHVGDGSGPRKFRACVQTSTGAIICKDITTLKDVTSGEVSWREPLND